MTQIKTETFTVPDPRTFEGNPFEVAERATLQVAHIARILATATDTARIMARNAEMTRQLDAGDKSDPVAFDTSAIGKRFAAQTEAAKGIEKQLTILAQAAGFDPRAPLGKE